MVSPELFRRYAFFAGLSNDQIATLARVADEVEVEAGEFFLHEGDYVPTLYMVVDGKADVVLEIPAREKEVVIATLGPGEVFGWSALVPPHTATASVKAATKCLVIAIDCRELLEVFEEEDPRFGYIMMKKAAQITRDRVAAMNIETLAYFATNSGV